MMRQAKAMAATKTLFPEQRQIWETIGEYDPKNRDPHYKVQVRDLLFDMHELSRSLPKGCMRLRTDEDTGKRIFEVFCKS